MVLMLLIRCISGVRSFLNMIFMGDLLEALDKFVKYHINVCIIVGGGIWNSCTFECLKF